MLNTYNFDLVLPDLKATNKKQIFKDLAKAISKKTGMGEQQLLIKLVSQEKSESLSVGQGVAMPHLKLNNLEQPFILFARMKNYVEFDTVDGEPIDLICCVISPIEETALHLQSLSGMTRMLSDKNLRDQIRNAEDGDDIYNILQMHAPIRKAA